MKKIIYTLLIMLAVASCADKDSLIYEQKPDERIQEVLDNYNTIIRGSTNGWLLALETKEKGGFNHWVNFTGENTCQMLSDADATSTLFGNSSADIKESSWRLKSVISPILMFDTYSYIHMLADPNEDVNDGIKGKGYITDFEFALGYYDNTSNTLDLKGRFNGSRAKMIACTPEQESAIKSGGLKVMNRNFEDVVSTIKYPVIEVGSNKVDLEISSRAFSVKYIDEEDEITTSSVAAYLDMKGLEDGAVSNLLLFDTLRYNSLDVTGLVCEDNKLFALVGGDKVEVVDNRRPAIPLRFGANKDYNFMKTQSNQLTGSLEAPYLTNIYDRSNTMINGNGGRYIVYQTVQFTKNAKSGKNEMKLIIRYSNKAGSQYNATWIFQYTENEDGTITFTDRDQTGSSNERGQEKYLYPMVDYFCKFEYSSYSTSSTTGTWEQNKARVTKVTPRTFKLDWAENKTKGLAGSLGGFYPVDATQLEEEGVLVGILDYQ